MDQGAEAGHFGKGVQADKTVYAKALGWSVPMFLKCGHTAWVADVKHTLPASSRKATVLSSLPEEEL